MKQVFITYFVHGTTTDNERDKCTGWAQGELSKRGVEQSIRLKDLIKNKTFDVVFCSDLKRAIDSATLTFEKSAPLVQDKRLRECNYGDFTQGDGKIVDGLKKECIDKPFPNGESYKDVEKRMRSFLSNLVQNYDRKRVAVVAHQAPQLALDVIVKGKSWKQAMQEDWRAKQPKEWRPGWEYVYEENNFSAP